MSHSTQAPVLFQPTEYQPLDANGDPELPKAQGANEPTAWDKVGTIHDEYLKHTLWRLEIPHGESVRLISSHRVLSTNNRSTLTRSDRPRVARLHSFAKQRRLRHKALRAHRLSQRPGRLPPRYIFHR